MWYVVVRESPAEPAETGFSMARGRTLSQFQEEFPTRQAARPFCWSVVGPTALFAPAVARNARRRLRVALTPTSASIAVGKRQSFRER
jgi:hypothetical protein